MGYNYNKVIKEIEEFLIQESYIEAGRNCGDVLEYGIRDMIKKNKTEANPNDSQENNIKRK